MNHQLTTLAFGIACLLSGNAFGIQSARVPLEEIGAELMFNAKDINGNTPTHLAAQNCLDYDYNFATAMLTALIDGGINPFIKNNEQKTPANIVEEILQQHSDHEGCRRMQEILSLFEKAIIQSYNASEETQSEK